MWNQNEMAWWVCRHNFGLNITHFPLQKNPYWIENNKENEEKCPLLAKAKEVKIDPTEVKFWNDMIEQYLKPLYEDKDAKKKVLQKYWILEVRMTIIYVFFLRIRRKTPLLVHSGQRRFEGAEEFLCAEFHARQLDVDRSHFHAAK